jgi:microcystin-dependent protein
MSGFWPQSFSQINDLNGKPIVGAKAFFYEGGTTTPISVYQDYGLLTPHPNPLSTDGYGRWPTVYFDDEAESFYRIRVTTASGVIIYDFDQVPIIGPNEGSGGGDAPVDPNAVFKTGDLKARYGEGFLDGFVRSNARSIGTAVSGATERANSDCQALYEFLWNADPNLAVAGGRGGSAAADWAANKPLTLPDLRGRVLVGLDDMGNLAAGNLTGATDLGYTVGAQSVVLTVAQIPSHDHGGTTSTAGAHTHTYTRAVAGGSVGGGSPDDIELNGAGVTSSSGDHAHTVTAQGGGTAHSNVQPSIAVTMYIRL